MREVAHALAAWLISQGKHVEPDSGIGASKRPAPGDSGLHDSARGKPPPASEQVLLDTNSGATTPTLKGSGILGRGTRPDSKIGKPPLPVAQSLEENHPGNFSLEEYKPVDLLSVLDEEPISGRLYTDLLGKTRHKRETPVWLWAIVAALVTLIILVLLLRVFI
jgi:hypothetical protein